LLIALLFYLPFLEKMISIIVDSEVIRMDLDTIAAISTPIGEGGIAIVRVSGNEAIPIVEKIFRGKKKLSSVDSHTIHYGWIINPETNEKLDESMVTVMRAPKTFTREDVVEVNVHGGIVSVSQVLQLIIEAGARLAEPGEFTKRAFLNGRIDLSQAEAVIDLIRSKTDRAMKVALSQVEGKLSREIKELRHQLIELMAHIEVNIDYPEHDVEEVTYSIIVERISLVKDRLMQLEKRGNEGKILREGVDTAIIGKPNVGKSSLLNALAKETRAIVTDIPGTTRDVIEEYVNVRGIPLKLTDTAGIRETEDLVEKIGVERSREVLKKADLILLVLNQSEPLDQGDYQLFELVKGMNLIVILNKMDLPSRMNIDEVKSYFSNRPIVSLSLRTEEGLDQLEEEVSKLFFSGKVATEDLTYISNTRHIALLREAIKSLEDARIGVEQRLPYDMIAIDIKKAWLSLGEIIGDAVSEDLVGQIFSQFCLGK
jgi:tRNA modification GTPase